MDLESEHGVPGGPGGGLKRKRGRSVVSDSL